jgi:hypothetical protein
MKGRHHSLEAKKKMSLRKLGKKLSKQHCQAISLGGRKRYFWSRERMNNEVYERKNKRKK